MKPTHTDVWLLPLNVKKIKVMRAIPPYILGREREEEIDLSPRGLLRSLQDSVRLLPRERQEVKR